MDAAYHRIMLKLSGEALSEVRRPDSFDQITDDQLRGVYKPFSHNRMMQAAQMLYDIAQSGVQLCVVTGGGNVWRGRRGDSMQMGAVAADQMGMLGTLQNCLYLCDCLRNLGQKAVVMAAAHVPAFAENYSPARAIDYLERGYVVFCACGLATPFFTTDTAVVVRTLEMQCDALFMAKSVDGVYDADPVKHPEAKLLKDLTYRRAIEDNLGVMDLTAMVLLENNRFPMVRVFALQPAENVLKVIGGDPMGSFVHP